jgi:ribosomal protein S7
MGLKNLRAKKDILYNSFWFNKFESKFFFKSKIILSVIKIFKYKHRYEAVFFFFETLEIIKPILFTEKKRRGRIIYDVPFLLMPLQQYKKSISWIVQAILLRKEKTLEERIYFEFLDIIQRHSKLFIWVQELNQKLLLNRAYQHYR